MTRHVTLSEVVMSVDDRIRAIETEELPANVPAILEAAALDAPDSCALNFFEEGITFSYAELLDAVLATARGFARLGVRRGDTVGVMLNNAPSFPVAWLAIARLGAVMVPINVAYTSRELEFVLANSDASWLCVASDRFPTVEQLSDELKAKLGGHIIVAGEPRDGTLDLAAVQESGRDAAIPLPALADIGCDDLLNIQYTSGTTGMPKGCMLTHRYWVTSGKVNAFRDGRRYSNILASVPYFYMDPQWLTLMTFFHRGTLFVARRQSSSRFMKWLRDYRINFALFPEIVYKLPPEPADRDNDVIRVNVYGLSPEVHADMEERYDFIVREAYGMTEIGSGMFMPIEATDMVGSGYCGRPSPFREARIVGPSGEVLGDDQEGELQIRGPGIMLGYFNNPEATNASFVDGWFRTGDLARRNPQGYYRLVGRIKDMIRRAGENIAANEVEAVLRSMPEVLEAAAVPEKDPIRDEEVKAFIVLRESVDPAAVSPEMVLDFCRQHLARFKVPRYIAFRGPFAKTPSGKIAKHLLLKEEAASPSRVYDANLRNWL
ncbi:MAG: AMP-binding protein [Xanthobacteraceae bacterium]|jgi:crotonobetaine/carnitine-CoA ligase|nr:AMP-binding protein [Xanthobacteraceae bacterium]